MNDSCSFSRRKQAQDKEGHEESIAYGSLVLMDAINAKKINNFSGLGRLDLSEAPDDIPGLSGVGVE